jgi:hypothetical protein
MEMIRNNRIVCLSNLNQNDLPLYISDIRQIVGYRTPVFIQRFPWRLHITITYNLPHLRLWYADVGSEKGSEGQTHTVVSNHVHSDHVPSFSCLDVWANRQETSGVYAIAVCFLSLFAARLSASSKENDLPLCISDIRQIVGYRTPGFIQPFPWRLHITITYNLPHLRLWYADVVTVIA